MRKTFLKLNAKTNVLHVTKIITLLCVIRVIYSTRPFKDYLHRQIETQSYVQRNQRERQSLETRLPIPSECALWRSIARHPSKLKLYRKHFVSHDVTDWFLFVAIFTENWHRIRSAPPIYLDVAANHARKWSSTWFFDRCMQWEGICVEPNRIYWGELERERNCKLVRNCLSDVARTVNFSRTAAYGGIIADSVSRDRYVRSGVNGTFHATAEKFRDKFDGVEQMKCTTLERVYDNRNSEKVHINFLNLDVEGHELPVLEGIEWDRTTIDVIVTENKGTSMRSFLRGHEYTLYDNTLKDDLWIRKGSSLQPDPVAIKWMSLFNKSDFSFSSV